jgi:hypothetical protein
LDWDKLFRIKKKIKRRIKKKKEIGRRKKINVKGVGIKMVIMGNKRENSNINSSHIQLRMNRT